MVTQRMQQLHTAYRRWKDETPPTDWFTVYRPLLHDILPNVSGNAVKVYVLFCMNADPTTGEARQSVKAIADYLGKSVRAVNDWLKELQDHRLVERIQAAPNGEAHTYLLAPDTRPWTEQQRSDGVLPEAQAQYDAPDSIQLAKAKVVILGLEPFSATEGDQGRSTQHAFTAGSLAERIRSEREKRKMPLKEISERSGLAIGYLVELEMGRKTNPTLAALLSLSKALGVPIGRLLGDPEVPAESG